MSTSLLLASVGLLATPALAQHAGHGDSGSSGGSHSMTMVFFSATNTPLFFSGWTPHNKGQYAATCLFLIALTVGYRALTAYKHRLEHGWTARARARRYVHVGERYQDTDGRETTTVGPDVDASSSAVDAESAAPVKSAGVLTVNGVRSDVRLLENFKPGVQPWRWSIDLPRSVVTFIITAVGYLLMLAVMTMNVGYFFSVLAGAFIGELALGRFGGAIDHHSH